MPMFYLFVFYLLVSKFTCFICLVLSRYATYTMLQCKAFFLCWVQLMCEPVDLFGELDNLFKTQTLGALNGQTKDAIPDKLWKWAESTGDTEGDSVVEGLSNAVMVEKNTRRRVNVRMGVLSLAVLGKHTRRNISVLENKLDSRVVANVRTLGSELDESIKAGIGLAQNSVAVTGNDTTRVKNRPKVVLDVLISVVLGDGLLLVKDEAEHLLGSKTMQGASKTLKTSRVGKVRIRQSRAN